MVVAAATGPVALDPDLIAEEQTASVLGNVYEPLVERDATLQPVPGLAEYWVSQDGDRRWTFRLRAGARFHDGQPLDAAAVVASLERTRARADAASLDDLEPIERIQVDDERTLSIWTRFPLATLPDRLSNTRISHPAAAPGEPPIGSGPYRFRRASAGGDVVLQAVGGAPAVRDHWNPRTLEHDCPCPVRPCLPSLATPGLAAPRLAVPCPAEPAVSRLAPPGRAAPRRTSPCHTCHASLTPSSSAPPWR